jgi:hypothetical protein
MGTSNQVDDPVYRSLYDHVLGPLSTAEAVVEAEYAEVEAERQAFERFSDRLASIETVSTGRGGPGQPQTVVETSSRPVEGLRSAFRETVMSVDHYEEAYGEPLVAHAAGELSADVAAGFRRESAAPFTEFYKTTLSRTVESAIEGRARFCDLLDAERSALETGRETLVDLLDDAGGPGDPTRLRGEFEGTLDDLAQSRQSLIQRRDPTSRTDGHDICEYLYRDAEWTYPVLTAVTRFRTTVG